MCKIVEINGEGLTAEEIKLEGFSGCELITDESGNTIGRRYFKWW